MEVLALGAGKGLFEIGLFGWAPPAFLFCCNSQKVAAPTMKVTSTMVPTIKPFLIVFLPSEGEETETTGRRGTEGGGVALDFVLVTAAKGLLEGVTALICCFSGFSDSSPGKVAKGSKSSGRVCGGFTATAEFKVFSGGETAESGGAKEV